MKTSRHGIRLGSAALGALAGLALMLTGGCDKPADSTTTATPAASSGAVGETPGADPIETARPALTKTAPAPAKTRPQPVTTAAPVASSSASAPVEPTSPGPRLTFDAIAHDYGEVWDSDGNLPASFTFRNTGTEKLVISEIKASCGCTTTSLERMEFEPGEGDTIQVRFNPKGKGKQRKGITVYSNDASNAPTVLSIHATVSEFFSLSPRYAQFGDVTRGEAESMLVTISSLDPDFEIVDITSTNHDISARIVDGDEAAGAPAAPENRPGVATLRVSLGEDLDWGAVTGYVRITGRARQGEDPVEHVSQLYVKASAYGRIIASRDYMPVGQIKGGVFDHLTHLSPSTGEPFAVLGVNLKNAVPSTGLSVAFAPSVLKGVPGWDIILSGDVGEYSGSVRGTVEVTTDVPGEEKLVFRFSGIAMPE